MTRNSLRMAGCVAAAVVVASAVPATAAEPVKFRIPAQSMQTALTLFAKQSGVQVLFPYDQVAGLQAQAVTGKMTPDAAVSRLILGSGLKVRMSNSSVIALALPARTSHNRPVQVANLGVTGLPFAIQAASTPVAALPQASGEEDSDAGSAIVVTGSRGLPRTVADSPTPIDVISATELTKTGKPGLLSALNTLVPSFNVPARAGGGTSTVISTGGLRGLNPDQTLILVNGKRRHKTSLINAVSSLYNGSVPVDLDMIPTSAVDHIEVLRDGAAAQYGSDAIAGVINIILKDDSHGGSASFTAGQNMDRSDGETFVADASIGTKLGEDGFADFFVSAKKQSVSNRAIEIGDCSITARANCIYTPINGQIDPRDYTADRLVTKNYGNFPAEAINLGYNASYNLGTTELYSFGTFGQRDSTLDYTFRRPSAPESLPEVYPNGFRPRRNIREQDLEFLVGAKGEVAGWNWDLSSGYGKNRSRQLASNTINSSLGPTSPTEFYIGSLISTEWNTSLDLTRAYELGSGNLQVSAGLQHRRETYEVVQGDEASSALGTYSYVNANGVRVTPETGGQAANGFTDEDAGKLARNNIAGYVDVAYDPTRDITVGGAVRFEHFDDSSGDTLIAKLNGRYAVTPWLSLRGAVSTGFRAPGLAQQIYATTTGQFRILPGSAEQVRLQIKTLPVASAAAIALGAEPLTPEKSTNFSAGFVLTPFRNFTLSVDAYQIKVKDRIAITSTLTGNAVSAILVANGLSPYISAQYYTNAIDTRTRGIDVVATYNHDIGSFAKVNWNIGYNYNKNIITDIIDNPSELNAINFGLFDRVSQANLTENLPKTKFYIGNVITAGDFSLNTRVIRYGKVASLQNEVARDRFFGAKWMTDAELTWKVNNTLGVSVGANNLFNVYPDANGIASTANGSGFYPTTIPYGFTGGYYYGRITLNY
ncbi:MAG: TonB-dependent receptor [Sphingobium sp.]|uniref:TonB-dependent receptor n=1 Tax=Sphingobium sp. TaxID=1912891 RepID=UPI0029BBED0B|nr:TonB-dependent receptor [Sphingobium sp.]MDX3911396.1 TonB-dependent receptor [Sphingobium sp.]